MEIIDFSKRNSIINKYMAEMRDKNYQNNRLLFRSSSSATISCAWANL